MSHVLAATYHDGIFEPDVQINLASGTRVRLIVETEQDSRQDVEEALQELEKLCAEFPVDSGSRLTRDQLHERR